MDVPLPNQASAPTPGPPPIVERLEQNQPLPTVILFVGMAGSGKTSLMDQIQTSLEESSKNVYSLNLDPAVASDPPYQPNIDIRDTVNYKEVMKQHKLGPNGAIMTSLNLFATKFDQVVQILDQRATTESLDYILVDTPGQIEAFTWSASGTIFCEALASSFPTILCFVVDTARCAKSPNTFMSNMLYSCSMLYRTKLPLVVAFNKSDVVSAEFCMEWMRDYEKFQTALDNDTNSGFYGSLTRSLSLVLDEFYTNFTHACGISAVTGDGVDDFLQQVENATNDFKLDYIQDLKNRMEEQAARQAAIARANVRKLEKDLQANQAEES